MGWNGCAGDGMGKELRSTLLANLFYSGAPFFPSLQRFCLLSGLQTATVVTLTTSKASSNFRYLPMRLCG